MIYLLSAWYKKDELGESTVCFAKPCSLTCRKGRRLAVLFVFQMLGSAFGSFVAAGCLTLDGVHGIRGWRWLFIM